MSAIDDWKPSGRGHPLLTALAAVALAWIASLVIVAHGIFYSTNHGFDSSIIRLAKLSVALPIVLTAVSYVAAQSDLRSRIVWGAAGLQVLYSCVLLVLFLPVLPVSLLYFPSAYFQSRTAASMVRNRKLEAGDESFR